MWIKNIAISLFLKGKLFPVPYGRTEESVYELLDVLYTLVWAKNILWPLPGRLSVCSIILQGLLPRCFATLRVGHCQGQNPLCGTPSNSPSAYSKLGFLSPAALSPRPFPRMLWLMDPRFQLLLLQGLCPTGNLSPDMVTRSGYPCDSTTLGAKLVQGWPKVIVVTHRPWVTAQR
jgi:hypothetical protein